MANSIKYNTGTEANALRVGNFHMGVGDVSKGPTSTTGFHSGINPPPGGYTIYVHNKNIGPSIQRAFNDAELIRITNTIASTSYTTVDECFNYFSGELDKMVVHQPMDFVVTDGLIFYVNAVEIPSYPRSGIYLNGLGSSNKNGFLTNGPTFNSNGFLEFDGVDDYVNTDFITGDFYNENGDWTINSTHNVVSNVGSPNGRSGISVNQRYKSEPDPGGFGINIFAGNYVVNLTHDDGNGTKESYQSQVPISIDYGKIENITATWNNASKTLNMYRNGELENTSTSTNYKWSPATLSSRTHRLATSTQGGWGYYFPMEIASSQIYNRTLTPSEIKQNYFKSPIITDGLIFAIDAGNLVSYEDGSTTAYSLTGSFSGSLTDGTGYSSDNGGVFTFDGNNDRIDNFSENIEPSAITIEYWKKWTVVSDDWLIGNQTSNPIDNNNGFYHRIDNPSYNFIARFGVGTTQRSVSYNPVVLNEWTHVATTFNSSEGAKLYWNGVLVNSNTSGGTLSYSNVLGLEIGGANDGSRDTPGPVGPVRIYDRALTAEEIMQNYSAGKGRFGA